MTLGYLQRNQNPNAPRRADGRRYWGYPTRRAQVQVIPVHTAETSPTTESAEAIADYFTRSTRPASYHEVVDSDSHVVCLPPDATAFGAVGWNSNGWHLSFATYASRWGDNPAWDDAALAIGAARARLAADRFDIPARRITLAQAERGERGFIDHARLDPDRRSDPGAGFPWGRFLEFVEGDDMPAPKDWDDADVDRMMAIIARTMIVGTDKHLSWHLRRIEALAALTAGKIAELGPLSDEQVDDLADAIAAALPSQDADRLIDRLAARLAG